MDGEFRSYYRIRLEARNGELMLRAYYRDGKTEGAESQEGNAGVREGLRHSQGAGDAVLHREVRG